MPLSRGIRFLSNGYIKDFNGIPDTEENIKSHILLEAENDENCLVKLADVWPSSVSLNASINATEITSSASIERIENAKSLGKSEVYKTPTIAGNSPIKSSHFFCAAVTINFENFGEYILFNERNKFFKKSFDEYSVSFGKEDNILFKKDFSISHDALLVERYTSAIGGFLQEEGSSGKAPPKIYPYGGFFEYGTHPKNIEQCFFQTAANSRITSILLHRLSALLSGGVNPSDHPVIKNLPELQKNNLYDDIKNGLCKINLTDMVTSDVKIYKSSDLTHISNTNLIIINFIMDNIK